MFIFVVARHKCLRGNRDDCGALFITHKIFQILWGPMLPQSTCFRTKGILTKPRPTKTKTNRKGWFVFLVGAGGVEPPQSKTTDLQSAPALRLRRAPKTVTTIRGASRGNRTLISSLEGLHSSL